MGLQVINNGAFDFDTSAEKIRISFQKAKEMFSELYGKLALDLPEGTEGFVMKVKADRSGFELVALGGGGDMLAGNNLSDLDDADQAKSNLNLGTAADEDSDAFATAEQGETADSAIQSIGVVSGSGISVDITDPQNPMLDFGGTNIFVDTIDFNPVDGILTLTRDGDTDLSVDLSAYTVLKIAGFQVDKGVGTNLTALEIGDKCRGWEGDNDVAFKVTALPHDEVDADGVFINRLYATNNSL